MRFYAARALRIYPLYWLVASVAVFALPQPLGLPSFALFGIASSGGDPVGVSWSLDIELQFYLALPFLMLLPIRIVLPLSVVLGGLVWAMDPGMETLVSYLPAFALGAACYLHDWRPSRSMALASLGAFVFATLAIMPFWHMFIDKTTPSPININVVSFFWMLPLLPFVAWSLRQKSSQLDRHLGNLSYPLYLVHTPIIALMEAPKPIECATAIMVAIIIYFGFDRPVDAWRVQIFERGPEEEPRLKRRRPAR
jgi:peptidoglycan/LPS O-acetylase OafA/YrhL